MEQVVRVLPDEDGVRVIVCGGEFDQDTLGPLREVATAAVDDPGVRRIVLDVTEVTFADSSMLNLMLLLLRSGRLVLAGPVPDRLGMLLDLTEVRALFTTTDGTEAARGL
ncbi:STAS domain-containing protein [Streptomyces sp. NPDC058623]|uniref:STAS domain-containing protein n=1 Tax=Streptomyces sp. NPDC058623 TaxID=3346563 RepID=UPI0036505C0C